MSNKSPLPVVKEIAPTEAQDQEDLCRLLRLEGLVHFAVPNGGRRGKVEAARLRRQGVQAGVPDLVLPGQDPRWRCLGIELKRRDSGRVSPEQEQWHAVLRACGWRVLICYGLQDAVEQLTALGLLPKRESVDRPLSSRDHSRRGPAAACIDRGQE